MLVWSNHMGIKSICFKESAVTRVWQPILSVSSANEVKNNCCLSFSQLVSGRNSTNPAIWLVPGAGEIFSSGPPQRAESVKLIYFSERSSGNRHLSPFLHFHRRLINATLSLFTFKSFCLRDRGRLGNEDWPISLKIGTQSHYVDLCNMPKFQLQRLLLVEFWISAPQGSPEADFQCNSGHFSISLLAM